MNRQQTGWGYIDWLKPEADCNKITLNVGIVSIAPHAHMSAHIHFTEQVIYILQGDGYSLVDGKKIEMPKDAIFHWKAGVIHEMFNTGETLFKHLMVSCPDNINPDKIFNANDLEYKITNREANEYLYAAIDGIRTQFLDTLHYTYIIFDSMGNLVTKTRVFPNFCCAHCSEDILSNSAPCMCSKIPRPIREEGKIECPYGLTALYMPIIFQGIFLGYVEGGFVHTSLMMSKHQEEGVYITPQSSILGAQMLLRRIAKAIVNFCEFYKFKSELMEKDLALSSKEQYQELLVANLKNAENSMTDLKINNHFLFNTLNQMASMAIEGGMLPLYQSIVDLSKMFYYTLRNNNNTVSLDKELEYLKAYLKLQKLRYGDGLTLHYDVQTNLSQWLVPFNFLMPIAENAFTHGFPDIKDKQLTVRVYECQNQLHFVIANNGKVLDSVTCRAIALGMKSATAHGLSMVYSKLRAAYNDDFSFEIGSDVEAGTSISLILPAREVKKVGIEHDTSCNL